MKIKKLYDASVLINLLENIGFIEVFEMWASEYNQLITSEIKSEIIISKDLLNSLIVRNILEILDPISKDKLKAIQEEKSYRLSLNDCSLYYYCKKFDNIVCLSDDAVIRQVFKREQLDLHGTQGIYLKLLKERNFPESLIEEKFVNLKKDSRVFPI